VTAEDDAPAPDLLWDGPGEAEVTVLLAHGAGAGRAHPFLARFAAGLGALGLRVARFDFPYMAARAHGERRGPDRAPVLLASLRAAAAATAAPPDRLVLAGKSMGGRMATMVADELGCRAVFAIGYPFHPPRRLDQLRVEHLRTLHTRCLILQGERDPFGTRAEVAGYPLSAAITVQWFADGDHSLVPRARSGCTAAAHFSTAIAAAAAFARA
jgi:predicted alpha/beta-hydrolase family hydrolase